MSNICNYVLKKGKNRGQSCGIKCSNELQLCKKHSIDKDLKNRSDESNESNESNESKESNESNESKESNESNANINKINKLNNKLITQSKKKDKVPKEKKELKEKKPNEKKEPLITETSLKVNVFKKQKIQAKRNQYSNYVLENNLVIHPVNKNIIGKQNGDKLIELSIEDIEYCKEHGFRYLQPTVMYFSDSDCEKKEDEMLKILKGQNKNDEENDFDEMDEIGSGYPSDASDEDN